ncbi:MAG: glycosyltransferase [Schwartzia sp.]|nr:glycosyltransferase [Schwartzia sp. (in: firmicutes)]
MKLSACYIAKNEEKNLPLSLETVRDIADELIVVDTGSTDATKKIALDAGATVLDFVWRDDFAAARNFALDHATGDWIIFLDADEGFLHPARVREKIGKIAALALPVDAIMVTRVNVDPETGKSQGNDRAARLFRNAPDIRYQGRIHETITHIGGKLVLYHDDGNFSVYHTGYAESIGMEKTERNFRLLQQEIAEGGEQPEQYFALAGCYFDFKDYRKAMKYAILSLDSPVQPVASRVPQFHIAIEAMRRLGWPLDEQLALADMALGEYPGQPDFYGERGMILSALGRLEEARASLCKAIEIYENKETPATAQTYFNEESAETVRARIREIDDLS